MQVWFYKREAQLGDYVYYDGSYSDLLNRVKTVVGVCFYINPYDKTQRLCLALQALTANQWGLYWPNWSEGITLEDSPEYDVFDIPTLANKPLVMSPIYVREDTYRDMGSQGDPDGFKIFPVDTVDAEIGWTECDIDFKDYKKGQMLPWGLVNTIKIIAHRNTILTDSNIQLPQPQKSERQTELSNLLQLMQDVESNNGGQTKYKQYYFPPASQCYAYEPVVKEEEKLSDNFKQGRWFLPSLGEQARIYWGYTHNAQHEATTNGIFADAIDKGLLTALTPPVTYWSSSENGSSNAFNTRFADGGLSGGNKGAQAPILVVSSF